MNTFSLYGHIIPALGAKPLIQKQWILQFWNKILEILVYLVRSMRPWGLYGHKFFPNLYYFFIPEMFQTKNDNNWPRSFQDEVRNVKLLMDDGRKTIAIHVGHLSDTGYHKKALFWSVLVFFNEMWVLYSRKRKLLKFDKYQPYSPTQAKLVSVVQNILWY